MATRDLLYNDIDFNGFAAINLPNAVNPQDAVPLSQVKQLIGNKDAKESVACASTTTLPSFTYNNGSLGVGATITANANGALPSQDGVALTAGNSFLYKDATNAAQNGIYVVTQLGDAGSPFILTRRDDFNSSANITSYCFTITEQGSTLQGKIFYLSTTGTITVGVTNLVFTTGSSSIPNTDYLPEGSTNLYFTNARVRSTDLAGMVFTSSTPITVSDTVLTGMGRLQAQITTLGAAAHPALSLGTNQNGLSLVGSTQVLELNLASTTSAGSLAQLPSSGASLRYVRSDNTHQVLDTSVVPENTNLYYTDTRVDNRITSQKGFANGLTPLNASVKIDGTYLDSAGIIAGLGYTPQVVLNGNGFVRAAGTSISYDNSTYLTTTLVSGNILVGNASNVATSVTMSGDATISNLGALTVSTNVIGLTKLFQTPSRRILGRGSAATGNHESLTIDQVWTLLTNPTNNTNSGTLNDVSTNDLNYLRFTNAPTVTGFANGASGKFLIVFNDHVSNSMALAHQNSGSIAANRIIVTGGQSGMIPPQSIAILLYDPTDSRWFLASIVGWASFPSLAGIGDRIVQVDAFGNASASYSVSTNIVNQQSADLTAITNSTKTGIWGVDITGNLTVQPASINRVGCRIVAEHRHSLTTGAAPGNITIDLDWGGTVLATTGAIALASYMGASVTNGSVVTRSTINVQVAGVSATVKGYLHVLFYNAAGNLVNQIFIKYSTTADLTSAQVLREAITFSSNAVNSWTSNVGITKFEA